MASGRAGGRAGGGKRPGGRGRADGQAGAGGGGRAAEQRTRPGGWKGGPVRARAEAEARSRLRGAIGQAADWHRSLHAVQPRDSSAKESLAPSINQQ